jgi:hypothetical protein
MGIDSVICFAVAGLSLLVAANLQWPTFFEEAPDAIRVEKD